MIVIVNYGVGNLGSIANMLKKIGTPCSISADPAQILAAQKLILPGVGAFDNGMNQLKSNKLIEALNKRVLDEHTPILGICLGMQLFCNRSEEGSQPGLGWIDADVRRFNFSDHSEKLRVPHMGWNEVAGARSHPLFDKPEEPWCFYFVHTYHVSCNNSENVLGTTHYGYSFASAVVRGNIMGVQFHPEKSHSFGMRLLKRFSDF